MINGEQGRIQQIDASLQQYPPFLNVTVINKCLFQLNV